MPPADRQQGPPPWEQVNALDAREVARRLGLTAASRPERGRKWACPLCDSSDALHAHDGKSKTGFHCFSCSRSPSVVDVAALVMGLQPADACRAMASLFGILDLSTGAPPVPQWKAPVPRLRAVASLADQERATEPPEYAELRGDGQASPASRAQVYAAVLAHLELGDSGWSYLTARALDPVPAAAYGFRSIDSAGDWSKLFRHLTGEFSPPELLHAGFMRRDDEGKLQPALPWKGREPALVIPYLLRGECRTLRFRGIRPDLPKGARYMSLSGPPAALPFNADVLRACAGEQVHITEGEIDAWTVHQVKGWRVVGLPGASTSEDLLVLLAKSVEKAGSVRAWFDSEPPKEGEQLSAGDRGFNRLRDVLQLAHGVRWIEDRFRRCRVHGAKDVNELHQRGRF